MRNLVSVVSGTKFVILVTFAYMWVKGLSSTGRSLMKTTNNRGPSAYLEVYLIIRLQKRGLDTLEHNLFTLHYLFTHSGQLVIDLPKVVHIFSFFFIFHVQLSPSTLAVAQVAHEKKLIRVSQKWVFIFVLITTHKHYYHHRTSYITTIW